MNPMTDADALRGNGQVVSSLERTINSGEHGLLTTAGLLKRVIAEDAWRDFTTKRNEDVKHDRFEVFVTTPPLRGLGATVELVEKLIADDEEAVRLLREALKGKPGRPPKGTEKTVDNNNRITKGGTDRAYLLDRLARETPELYEQVRAKQLTANAAAIAAGFRHPTATIRTDNPASIAATLRRKLSPNVLGTVARLLNEEVPDGPALGSS